MGFMSRPIAICYHSVGNSNMSGLSIDKEIFEQQILLLKSKGLRFEKLIDQGDDDKKTVSISFDDGYLDNYDVVLPILKKHKVLATFFITVGALEKNDKVMERLARYSGRLKFMKTDHVKKLHELGHEIGNHTFSHPCLKSLSSDQITAEIKYSQLALEQITNCSPRSVAIPFGRFGNHFTSENFNLLKDLGFLKIASLNKTGQINNCLTPRFPITQNTSSKELEDFIDNKWNTKELIKKYLPKYIFNQLNSFEKKVCDRNSDSLL